VHLDLLEMIQHNHTPGHEHFFKI